MAKQRYTTEGVIHKLREADVLIGQGQTMGQVTNKPVDPDQQRIKALSNQKQQISQQLKNIRAQSKLKKAQKAMQSVRAPKPIKSM